jgi:hypothetical protein
LPWHLFAGAAPRFGNCDNWLCVCDPFDNGIGSELEAAEKKFAEELALVRRSVSFLYL